MTSIVVMGVSGAGKTTVGRLLAASLDLPFVDADDLHPVSNVAKMTRGLALDDQDRQPWLTAVADEMKRHTHAHGVVVACSALKRRYRDTLRHGDAHAVFLLLDVERGRLEHRLSDRRGHFMPASLLASQLDALESLGDDELGFTLACGNADPAEIAARARVLLHGSAP